MVSSHFFDQVHVWASYGRERRYAGRCHLSGDPGQCRTAHHQLQRSRSCLRSRLRSESSSINPHSHSPSTRPEHWRIARRLGLGRPLLSESARPIAPRPCLLLVGTRRLHLDRSPRQQDKSPLRGAYTIYRGLGPRYWRRRERIPHRGLGTHGVCSRLPDSYSIPCILPSLPCRESVANLDPSPYNVSYRLCPGRVVGYDSTYRLRYLADRYRNSARFWSSLPCLHNLLPGLHGHGPQRVHIQVAQRTRASSGSVAAPRHRLSDSQCGRDHNQSHHPDRHRSIDAQLVGSLLHSSLCSSRRPCHYSPPADGPSYIRQPRTGLRSRDGGRIGTRDNKCTPHLSGLGCSDIPRAPQYRHGHHRGSRNAFQSRSTVFQSRDRSVSVSGNRTCRRPPRGHPPLESLNAASGTRIRASADPLRGPRARIFHTPREIVRE